VEVGVQINGKVRARLIVPAGTDAQGLTSIAMDDEKIQALVAGKTVVKVIAVPDKLINLVVR
jgi:leucyl-tRNA synthetase